MFLLKFVCILLLSVIQTRADYCLSNDDNPYKLFSTKTPYDEVRGSGGSETTCKPIQIWMIVRHGTRHADEEDLDNMKRAVGFQKDLIDHEAQGLLPEKDGLCMSDLDAIKNWTWDESMESQPEFLTQQGWKDLKSLAERYKNRYKLLQEPYTSGHYYFRHTWTERTNQSCRAFIDGLFGDGSNSDVDIEAFESDEVILPYGDCKAWIDEVLNNDERKEERKAFRKSVDYQELLIDVTNRMGYKKLLKHDDIDAMYDNCRFDKTKYLDKLSPWCSIFTKRELLLMEYHEDLGRFYKCSYGNQMHKKLGCMPLKNLMNTFDLTIENNGTAIGPKVIAMFSHDTMLDMMYTAMDYAKDQTLLSGTDYEDFLINRKYSTSRNTPFAGNVAAVLHDCGLNKESRFKVEFFINERPMMLPGCDRGLCDWDHLTQYYSGYEDCNLNFCDES